MQKFAIIVAGGSGCRFGSTIPKQFSQLAGKPVLMYSIEAFYKFDKGIKIIAVLPSEHISLWSDLCKSNRFSIPHSIVEGGQSRFQSVKNALDTIVATDGIVAVHDGARPLVTEKMIADGFNLATSCDSAIPSIPVTDSIRKLDRNGSHIVDRESIVAVQTPQIFNLKVLKSAYNTNFSPIFTDDASVVEYSGTSISLYEGNNENIKITHPIDLKIAELILSGRND